MGINRIGYLAIVTLDSGKHKVLFKRMIRPRMTTDEYVDFRHTLKYSGITRADGIPYAEAIGEVKALLRGAIVVGHNVKSDLDALELANPEAHCVYDTAVNPQLNSLVQSEKDKPQSKLRVLAQCLLGRSIQCTGTHDPVEDALAIYS